MPIHLPPRLEGVTYYYQHDATSVVVIVAQYSRGYMFPLLCEHLCVLSADTHQFAWFGGDLRISGLGPQFDGGPSEWLLTPLATYPPY